MRSVLPGRTSFGVLTRGQQWTHRLGSQGLASTTRSITCRTSSGKLPLQSLLSSASRARVAETSFLASFPLQQSLTGHTQVRSFKKANYTEKIQDNERTEEILETLSEREDMPPPQSGSTAPQDANEEHNPHSSEQADKWTEHLTKGKLLTTPSRLFKLIIPLTTPQQGHEKGIEPIGILVHPQQPLSYLEKLIQSEVPPIEGELGKRPPAVSFIALQHEDNAIKPKKRVEDEFDHKVSPKDVDSEGQDKSKINGQGIEGRAPVEQRRRSREEDVKTYSYPRKTDASLDPLNGEPERFVRWSQATEIGDFIRDASRVGEFVVMIEGAPSGLGQIRVTVPSFEERTYFLRLRLRKLSRRIQAIADVKSECDALAHKGAQRVAVGGFGILATWWFTVYKLTFETDLGWDVMEPVTYLVSLSTLMGGYLWFLYHNREISYKSALDFTISTRQRKLYDKFNVDLQLWESLIDEGKTIRREIKTIASEYDAEWDERVDEQDERVTEELRRNRKKDEEKKSRDDKASEKGEDD